MIREAEKPRVAPKEPHQNSKNGASVLEMGVDECFGEVDPDIAEVHQIADYYAAFEIVHDVCAVEEAKCQEMMKAHFNMVVSFLFIWHLKMTYGT